MSVCGTLLSPLVTAENVCAVYAAADLHRLDRLLFRCASVMAEEIDALLPRKEFRSLVLASAHSVRNREAVDSIPVIEEITDALAQLYGISNPPYLESPVDADEVSSQAASNTRGSMSTRQGGDVYEEPVRVHVYAYGSRVEGKEAVLLASSCVLGSQ